MEEEEGWEEQQEEIGNYNHHRSTDTRKKNVFISNSNGKCKPNLSKYTVKRESYRWDDIKKIQKKQDVKRDNWILQVQKMILYNYCNYYHCCLIL